VHPTFRAALAISTTSIVLVPAGWALTDRATGSTSPMAGSGVETSSVATTMADARLDLPAWQTIEIVDVDGETFTLADFIGTPVLVETFATWCSNCRAQLGDTQQAAAALGDDAEVVALSVETSISADEVAEYAADNGFIDIRFAVMGPELLAELADAFGTTVANPPSTPKFVIDAAGDATELLTGPESVEDIVANLRAAGPPSTPGTGDEAGDTDITDTTHG